MLSQLAKQDGTSLDMNPSPLRLARRNLSTYVAHIPLPEHETEVKNFQSCLRYRKVTTHSASLEPSLERQSRRSLMNTSMRSLDAMTTRLTRAWGVV
jgi:hypothetical protein